MSKTVILYHKGCSDGFGAAWAAWKKLGDKATYIAVKYDEEPPKNLVGKRVYILDFCYPAETIKHLSKITRSLVIIDHHFSRKKIIKSVPNYIYSEKNSGAILAWQYFHPGKNIPKLIKYIEDIDLWKRELPHTNELCASLWSYDKDFKIWNKIAKDWETGRGRKHYLDEGKAMSKARKQVVEDAVRNSHSATFLGHKARVSNSHVLASEIAHALLKKNKVSVGIVWYQKRDHIKVRLNSEGSVDVSKMAQKFGDGGGHKHSAAFRLKLGQKLPWKLISDNIS